MPLAVTEFRTGDVPSADECHERRIVAVGTMAGMTYEQALASRPMACKKMTQMDDPPEHLGAFISWLRRAGKQKKRKAAAALGDTTVTFGAFKGRSVAFEWLYDTEPAYCADIVDRYDSRAVTGNMREFIDYVKERGTPVLPEKSLAELAETVFTGGKMMGRSFADVMRDDPGYCRWARGLEDPGRAMAEFAKYLDKAGFGDDAADDVHRLGAAELGERTFSGGRMAGRTFADVAGSDAGYCTWAMSQAAPGGSVAAFVAYLHKVGFKPVDYDAMSADELGACEFTTRKHRGRTFRDVCENDPGYTQWAKGLTDPSAQTRAFLRYVDARRDD